MPESLPQKPPKSLFLGILPMAATFICLWLYKRNVKTIWIIFGIFAVCIAGCGFGIF